MVGDRLLGERVPTRQDRPAIRRYRAMFRRCVTGRSAVRAIAAVTAWTVILLVLAPAASATTTLPDAASGQAGVSLPVWPVAIIGSLLIIAGALVLGAAAFVWPRRRR
jgi:hypothetical protein